MINQAFTPKREAKEEVIHADLVVVGGGMAGVCCALTAARAGIQVVLVQDRPVLGGNASSEVRLWILGATSHMGNNNRWAREGGVIDEILVENTFRNKEGNPLILDTILLEKLHEEPNIKFLLNTSVYEVEKSSDVGIASVTGFCSQNSTRYVLKAELYCDASGDGIISFLSGASFRMGAEKPEEFGEGFAPDIEDYGELLGHSIYFYTKDIGRPVKFVAPSFALKNMDAMPKIRNYQLQDDGCRLWWVEYGGRLDTVHQSEDIKWELWRVIYGIWNHVKNSGEFPDAEHLTLEWVGTVPGKRESRRFMGDYILKQQDVVQQRQHYDAVAFGGWSLDLHPADGVYSEKPSCNQWHAKGVYQIPYRCFYSKEIENLFFAGRIISATHVAFGSSRVMATCAHGGQAVGMAAALAIQQGWKPRQLSEPDKISLLQQALNKTGQSIPHVPFIDPSNVAQEAKIIANSELTLKEIPFDGPWISLEYPAAQLLPLAKDTHYTFRVAVKADRETQLSVSLRISEKAYNYTPERSLEEHSFSLNAGEQVIEIPFSAALAERQYAFLTFHGSSDIAIRGSKTRISGVLSVFNKFNKAVSNYGKQEPPEGIGVDAFEFWVPLRRPGGNNIAMHIAPALSCFGPENLKNGRVRPAISPNVFVADPQENKAVVDLYWEEKKNIKEIKLFFDTDYDQPMESSLLGHSEDVMPFCVREFSIINCGSQVLYTQTENHQTLTHLVLEDALETDHLQIVLKQSLPHVPIALFEIMCF